MKQTVKHSVRIEYEKSWKYIYFIFFNSCKAKTLKKDALRKFSPKCQRLSWVISRSSSPVVFCKRDILGNFARFSGNLLSPFSIKLQSFSLRILSKTEAPTEKFCHIFRKIYYHYRTPQSNCLVFHYFKSVFSLCISFCGQYHLMKDY